jgi:hypothetical protein
LAYIEGWQGYKSESSVSDPNIDSVELKFGSFNKLVFDVVCAQPAFFVFSYPYSTRWQAKIDGQITPVYRCNAIEHTVRILPGKHTIEFRYCSPSAVAGAVVSCLALIAIIWYLCRNPGMAKIRRPVLIATVIFCVLLLTVIFYSFYNGANIGTRYLWTSKQIQPHLSSRYNLAYGKKTMMSGTEKATYSSLGVDGDRVRNLLFSSTDTQDASWQVDFGAEQDVREIFIYKMQGGYSSIEIPFEVVMALNDGTLSYKQTITEEDAGDYWHISVPGIKARFIGLRTLKSGPLFFSEVEVYK